MPEEIKKLFQFGHLFKSANYRSDELASAVKSRLDDFQVFHDRSLAKIELIRRNTSLTARGRAEAFGKLRPELEKELQDLCVGLKGYAAQIRQLEDDIKPKRHPRDDLAWQLECREIRDHVKGLDPAEQEPFVLAAIERGDVQVAEAIRFAPIPFKFATQNLMDRIDAARSEAQHPEKGAQLADLRTAAQEVRSAANSVRAELSKHGLEIDGDALSAAEAA